MIDGQDNNNFGVAGSTIPLNNPDAIQEVRLVTNQFSAEYGRNSSAVFNAITRSGTQRLPRLRVLVSQRQRVERVQQHTESRREWFLQSERTPIRRSVRRRSESKTS